MLSVPMHGWVDITIGDWSDRASYLTDLPCDLLDALITKLQNWIPTCISCDAEGWEYIIVFDSHNIHIIESKDDFSLISIEKSIREVAEEVYNDISEHVYEWSLWNYDTEDEEKRISNERVLEEKLILLRNTLDRRNN